MRPSNIARNIQINWSNLHCPRTMICFLHNPCQNGYLLKNLPDSLKILYVRKKSTLADIDYAASCRTCISVLTVLEWPQNKTSEVFFNATLFNLSSIGTTVLHLFPWIRLKDDGLKLNSRLRSQDAVDCCRSICICYASSLKKSSRCHMPRKRRDAQSSIIRGPKNEINLILWSSRLTRQHLFSMVFSPIRETE